MSSIVDMKAFKKDLSRQSLGDLSEELGEEILREKVTELDLSSNNLSSLPPSISSVFSTILSLDLSSNRLTVFPLELCALHSLQILIVKHNFMKSLPVDFRKLRSLKELNLSGNRFNLFPPQLSELEGLKDLHLGGNAISYIPPSIKKLQRLDYLYLGGNLLEELPPEIGDLTNLTALILCDNKLTHLPKQLIKLTELKSLRLHQNQLQTLPQNLVQLTNLQELSLRNNPLVIRFIKEWPNSVPSLMEIAGNSIKKNSIPYNEEMIPTVLMDYLNQAKQCDNPKCNGVYFNPLFQRVKFVDFCGKYRVPLLQYLCSPMCVHEEACHYGHNCGSHSGSEEEEEAAKYKMKKVLLG